MILGLSSTDGGMTVGLKTVVTVWRACVYVNKIVCVCVCIPLCVCTSVCVCVSVCLCLSACICICACLLSQADDTHHPVSASGRPRGGQHAGHGQQHRLRQSPGPRAAHVQQKAAGDILSPAAGTHVPSATTDRHPAGRLPHR